MLRKYFQNVYLGVVDPEVAKDEQEKFESKLDRLAKHKRTKPQLKKYKNDVFKNAEDFYDVKNINYNTFINKTFQSRKKEDKERRTKEQFFTPQETSRGMFALESQKFAAGRNNQAGQGPKILTLDHMLTNYFRTIAK